VITKLQTTSVSIPNSNFHSQLSCVFWWSLATFPNTVDQRRQLKFATFNLLKYYIRATKLRSQTLRNDRVTPDDVTRQFGKQRWYFSIGLFSNLNSNSRNFNGVQIFLITEPSCNDRAILQNFRIGSILQEPCDRNLMPLANSVNENATTPWLENSRRTVVNKL
jgi:hypothetical protein